MNRRLIILEGPDGAGKTSLARFFEARSCEVVHNGPYLGETKIAHHYFNQLRSRLDFSASCHPLVMDRSWLSEPIYAEVARQAESRVSTAQRRMLDRAALTLRAVVVLCLPGLKACQSTWQSRKGDEYLQKAEQLEQVWHRYHDTMFDLETLDYDYELDPSGERLMHNLQELDEVIGSSVGAGNYRQGASVLIGETPNLAAHGLDAHRVPFVAWDRAGCSAWLADQLEGAKISERDLYWFNVHDETGAILSPEYVTRLCPRRIVAMGGVAADWCAKHNLRYQHVPHPQHAKRFKYFETYPLIDKLKE